jgi:hypothetical protein
VTSVLSAARDQFLSKVIVRDMTVGYHKFEKWEGVWAALSDDQRKHETVCAVSPLPFIRQLLHVGGSPPARETNMEYCERMSRLMADAQRPSLDIFLAQDVSLEVAAACMWLHQHVDLVLRSKSKLPVDRASLTEIAFHELVQTEFSVFILSTERASAGRDPAVEKWEDAWDKFTEILKEKDENLCFGGALKPADVVQALYSFSVLVRVGLKLKAERLSTWAANGDRVAAANFLMKALQHIAELIPEAEKEFVKLWGAAGMGETEDGECQLYAEHPVAKRFMEKEHVDMQESFQKALDSACTPSSSANEHAAVLAEERIAEKLRRAHNKLDEHEAFNKHRDDIVRSNNPALHESATDLGLMFDAYKSIAFVVATVLNANPDPAA